MTDNEHLLEAVRVERLENESRARAKAHELQLVEDESGRMLGVACSCKSWAIDLPLGEDPTAFAAASPEVLRAHALHVTQRTEAVASYRLDDTPGIKCRPFYAPPLDAAGRPTFVGFICGPRQHRQRCEFCNRLDYVRLCDYPTGGPCKTCKGEKKTKRGRCHLCAETGRAMCNRKVCTACVASKPCGSDSEDYCPDHRERAGFPALIWREDCRWLERARYGGACLHRGCPEVIEPGQFRVLYFPARGRVMCNSCGTEYLKITTERPKQ